MPLSRVAAIEHFATLADRWSQTTIALVAAGSVVFLLGTHDEKPDGTDIETELRARVLGDRDVAQAQVYRYVGLAKALAADMDENDPEGVVTSVLQSRSATGATKHVVDWLAALKIDSLDALAERLGIYRRAPARAPRKPAAASAGDGMEPEDIADATLETPDPVHTLELIAERITDVDLIKGMIQVLQARLETLASTERRARRPRATARASA